MATTNKDTKVVTEEVRLSFVHVFEKDDFNDKYSVSVIVDKKDKKTLARIKAAIKAAKTQGKSSKWNGKVPGNLKMPLRDGDKDRPDDEAYAGSYFFNANSSNKPGVVQIVNGSLQEIIDTSEVYSGCYGKVSVNFYPFDVNGNRGIAAGLNHVLKTKDGDFLGGRSSAEDDFGDMVDEINDDADANNMDDYLG